MHSALPSSSASMCACGVWDWCGRCAPSSRQLVCTSVRNVSVTMLSFSNASCTDTKCTATAAVIVGNVLLITMWAHVSVGRVRWSHRMSSELCWCSAWTTDSPAWWCSTE